MPKVVVFFYRAVIRELLMSIKQKMRCWNDGFIFLSVWKQAYFCVGSRCFRSGTGTNRAGSRAVCKTVYKSKMTERKCCFKAFYNTWQLFLPLSLTCGSFCWVNTAHFHVGLPFFHLRDETPAHLGTVSCLVTVTVGDPHVFVLAKKLNWLKHFYASPSCEGVFVPAPVLSFWRHIQQEHSSTSFWHLGSYYLKFWVAKTQLWWTCMKRTTLDIFRANKDSIIKDSCLSYCVE